MLMNCGSIAIALSAEYGDVSDGASSFSGRICSTDWFAARSHAAMAGISPISPIPQLRVERSENSGTLMPARRDLPIIEAGRPVRGAPRRQDANTRRSGRRLTTRKASRSKSKK